MLNKILKLSNIEVLPINLQRFADPEVEDISDDVDDVVDYPDEEMEEDEEEEIEFPEIDESEDGEEVADPQDDEEEDSKQTPEENAKFKKMRLKAEADAKKKFEAERLEIQRMKQELQESQAEKQIRQEYLSQQKVWDKADAEGVSEEVARKLLESEVQSIINGEKLKVKERFSAIQKQRAEYKTDKHFDEVDKLAQEAVENNQNIDYHTAYKFFYFDIAKKHEGESEKNATKRTLANVQDRMKRRSAPASSSAPVKTNLSKTTMEINNFLGIDSREVAQHKKKNSHRFKI
jgi:hypothetical protein